MKYLSSESLQTDNQVVILPCIGVVSVRVLHSPMSRRRVGEDCHGSMGCSGVPDAKGRRPIRLLL